ncbi:MAG: hypothetical protein WC612_01625 [Bdellovibrionales bacterium]
MISAANSIQQTNNAYLAQLTAARVAAAASPSASSSGGSFASTLSTVQSAPLPFTPLPPPTPLTPSPKAAAVTSVPLSAPAPAPLSAPAPVDLAERSGAAESLPPTDAVASPQMAEVKRPIEAGSPEDTTNVPTTDENLSLDDLVDLLNPLQHIPIVGTIYRAVTGDTIKPDVQVVGSILFGLATGSVLVSAASGIASAIFEQNTGEEPTVQMARAIFGDEDTVQLAAAETPVLEGADGADEAVVAEATPDAVVAAAEVAPEASAIKMAGAITPDVLTTAAQASSPLQATTVAALASTPKPSSTKPSAGMLVQTGGIRVGNTIYASPQLRSAARIAAATPAKVDVPSPAVVEAPSEPAAALTLGDAIHQQALAGQSGQPLPPEFIQDMMLKALDKYTAAQNMATMPDAVTSIQ